MVNRYTITSALTRWPSQPVAYTFVLTLLMTSYLEGSFPDFLSILVGFATLVGVSYFVGTRLGSETLFGTIGAGAISYAVYSIILAFMKVSSTYIVQDEIVMAISFGLMAGLVNEAIKYFRFNR